MASKTANKRIAKAKRLVKRIDTEAKKLPKIAYYFGAGISLTAKEIFRTIKEKKWATDRQLQALENMLHGAKQWTGKRKET